MNKRKAGAGHGVLQERDRRWCRQAMLAAQMEKSADKAMAAVSVIVAAASPVAVVGKKLEHEIEAAPPLRFPFWASVSWFPIRGGGRSLGLLAAVKNCRPARGNGAAGTPPEGRLVFDALGLGVDLAKPTLMSFAQNGTSPQRITSARSNETPRFHA
jgi:hypothetical protein